MSLASATKAIFASLVALAWTGLSPAHALRSTFASNLGTSLKGWHVSSRDKRTLFAIVKLMRSPAMDASFTWTKVHESEWTFPYVKVTDPEPKASLVLHMMHRHGMAPWMAAMHKDSFHTFHSQRVVATGDAVQNVMQFVDSQEHFPPVLQLKQLLESLSLSALRNLHSFDHDWSLTHGKQHPNQPHCTEDSPEKCGLQVAFSQRTRRFLEKYGFSPVVANTLKQMDRQLMGNAYGGLIQSLSPYIQPAHYGFRDVMEPRFTGKLTTVSCDIKDAGSGCFLHGRFFWEDGGRALTRVPVKKGRMNSLYTNGKLDNEKVAQYVEDWLRDYTKGFYDMMQQDDLRLVRWTSEQAELSTLFVDPVVHALRNK